MPAAAAAKPKIRLAAILTADDPRRSSASSRTVAVVQELKVVSPPASPVASPACHSEPSPMPAVSPCAAPIMKHPATFTSSVAQGQCSGAAPAPRPAARTVRLELWWANQLSTPNRSRAPAIPKTPTRTTAITGGSRQAGQQVSRPASPGPRPPGPAPATTPDTQPTLRAVRPAPAGPRRRPRQRTW
jgi:hypothetical protein